MGFGVVAVGEPGGEDAVEEALEDRGLGGPPDGEEEGEVVGPADHLLVALRGGLVVHVPPVAVAEHGVEVLRGQVDGLDVVAVFARGRCVGACQLCGETLRVGAALDG